jgi:tRNA dimethylallyltransferase
MTDRAVARLREDRRTVSLDVPLALVGPTATGKTEASLTLARRLDAEILIVDSMTVYRGMDVGTAKPTREERATVPHHLLDLAEPGEGFSVARFQSMGRAALTEVGARGETALLVGGSGLYFRALVDDLEFPGTDPGLRASLAAEARALGPRPLHRRLAAFDPDAADRIQPENARRTVRALEVAALTGRPFSAFSGAFDRYPSSRVRAAGVRMEPETLAERIDARVEAMAERGLVEEVRRLVEGGSGPFLTSSQAIGYAEIAEHLAGRLSLDEALERTRRRSRALARRQMAWFRRDPRIRWFDVSSGGAVEAVDDIERHLREEEE